jgi:uncharacterized protein (TIGR03435 family)
MQDMDDVELLRRYTAESSETAFATLVARHVNLVYSVAMRHVGNPHQAQEVTQAVFVVLARKAHALRKGTLVAGWLHKTAWFVADNLRKTEIRRRNREQEAYMQSLLDEPESDAWAQIAPLLDTALAGLSDKDRDAIVLRFFNDKKLSEVAAALGTSGEAARKRVDRAVEKLRHFFTRRGVVLPAAAVIASISAHSVQAAPAGLAVSATGATVSGSTLALVKATLTRMAWIKLKTAVAAGTAVLLAAGIAIMVVGKVRSSSLIEDAIRNVDVQSLEKAPAVLVLRPTRYPGPAENGVQSQAKIVVRNMPLSGLFAFAYDYEWWRRVVLPADAPQGRYDLLLTLTDDSKRMVRQEIQRQLGLVAHREARMTDVLLLEMAPAKAARLKMTGGGRSAVSPPQWTAAVRRFAFTNLPVTVVARILGNHLGAPVFDRTGLSGNYDLAIEWSRQNDTDSEEQAIRQTIADKLGLQLISRQEMADLLVVENTGR